MCTNPALFGRSLLILWKKLSDSRKKPFDFLKKPSGLQRSRAANAFQKGVPNRGINFKDTYHIYSSKHFFIALRWHSEMIIGFHEYIYQDREYIIRAMNTKHAQCTCLYFQLVTKPYTYGSSCSRLHVQLHSVILSTFVIKSLRQC